MNFKHKYSRILLLISKCFKANLITAEEKTRIKEFIIHKEYKMDLLMKEIECEKEGEENLDKIAIQLKRNAIINSGVGLVGKRASVNMEMPKKMHYVLSNEGEFMEEDSDKFMKIRNEMKNNHTQVVQSPINFTKMFRIYNEQDDDDDEEEIESDFQSNDDSEEISSEYEKS